MPPTSQTSQMSLPRPAKLPQPAGAESRAAPPIWWQPPRAARVEALERLLAEARPRLLGAGAARVWATPTRPRTPCRTR